MPVTVSTGSKEPRPPPRSYVREWTSLEVDLPFPVKLQMPCSLSYHLDCNLMKDLKTKLFREAAPELFIHRNCKVINIYCFKILIFKVISYSAKGS